MSVKADVNCPSMQSTQTLTSVTAAVSGKVRKICSTTKAFKMFTVELPAANTCVLPLLTNIDSSVQQYKRHCPHTSNASFTLAWMLSYPTTKISRGPSLSLHHRLLCHSIVTVCLCAWAKQHLKTDQPLLWPLPRKFLHIFITSWTIGFTAKIPPTTTRGTAPAVGIRKPSENVQK